MLITIPQVCIQCKQQFETDRLHGSLSLRITDKIGSSVTKLTTSIHWCSIHCAFEWMSGQFIDTVEESNQKVKIHPDVEAVRAIIKDAQP